MARTAKTERAARRFDFRRRQWSPAGERPDDRLPRDRLPPLVVVDIELIDLALHVSPNVALASFQRISDKFHLSQQNPLNYGQRKVLGINGPESTDLEQTTARVVRVSGLESPQMGSPGVDYRAERLDGARA